MGRLWSFFSGNNPAPPSTSSPNPAPTVTTKPPKKKKPPIVNRIGRWILAFFFGSDPADNRINIEVKHLAAIWLQYNKYPETKAGDNRVTALESSLQTGPAGLLVQASQKSPVNSLVQEFIEPYEQMYKNQNALEGAIKMADYLEQYGNCPSVAEHLAGTDNEMQEIQTVKEHLLKITLKDHSLRVARNLLQLLKKTYQNADLLIPKAVVTALGHDLGKILVLNEGVENHMTDHPLLSSTIIEKIFFDITPGGEPVWLIEAMQTIKAHHTKSRDEWTQLLKRADNEARNMEIAEINKQLSVKEWNEWFNTDGLIKLLSEYINVPQANGKLRAFSLMNVVYCSPDYVVDAALRLAYLKRVINVTLIKKTETTSALRVIVAALRQANLVTDDIRDNTPYRKYNIKGERINLLNTSLIPLKIEAFGDPAAIESAKNTDEYFRRIQAVNLVQ